MKFKFLREGLFYWTLFAVLTGCYPGTSLPYNIPESTQRENIYYVPSNSNAPLLSEKNEYNLNANYSFGSKHGTVQFQGAYAPTENIGISGNIEGNDNNNKIFFTRQGLAVGYFKPFSSNWLIENYLGFETGHLENEHATGRSKISTTQIYLQPAIAVSNNLKTFQAAFVSRFSTAHFKIIDTTFNNDRERFSAAEFKVLSENPNYFFWEPGVSIRFGWQKFLFDVRYTLSANLSKTDFNRGKDNFTVGATLRFNNKKSSD